MAMNKQKKGTGIEWTMPYGRTGYTWNPVFGCKHDCTWTMPDGTHIECYAATIANRFGMDFKQYTFKEHILNDPLRLKKPSCIFVGSMADLFGHWVPGEDIKRVLDVMRKADWHIFQTLSKYPIRLAQFNPYPDNVWVGVSLPMGRLSRKSAARALAVYLKHLSRVQARVRFMSIEPLWFNAAPVFRKWFETYGELPLQWAIIGAASNGRRTYQPDRNWVDQLVAFLKSVGVPVFMKNNLKWTPRLTEFPPQ